MGFMSSPSVPGESQETKDLKEAEKARLAKEEELDEARKRDTERKRKANLLGTRSLQDEEISGFSGYRRKMGAGSIRE